MVLRGNLSFLSVPSVVSQLRSLPPSRTVYLRLEVDQIDHAAIEAIRGWRVGYQNAGGTVVKEPLEVLWRELLSRPTASAA